MSDEAAVSEKPQGSDAIETCQDVEKTILKISKAVQVLRNEKNTLDLIEQKSDEEKARLITVEETLNQELEELNNQFELVNKLITEIQNQTYTMINPEMADEWIKTLTTVKTPSGCDSADFRQVVIFNNNNSNTIEPAQQRVMIMESMTDPCDSQTNCRDGSSSLTDSTNEVCCHHNQCSDETCNTNMVEAKTCASDESYNLKIKYEICKLKEHLQCIVKENQELRFKMKSSANRNDVLTKALERPAPFKKCTDGGVKEIRFPGKKEMEEKLLVLKTEITQLNKEIEEVKINQLRLKTAKHFINKYSSMVSDCKCGDPLLKENINTNNLKVKKQQIENIELQINRKNNELNKLIADCELTIKRNNKLIVKTQKMSDSLIEVQKKIQEYDFIVDQQMIDDLGRIYHEIDTLDLLTAKHKEEITQCNEKLKDAQYDTREVTSKTQKLEESLKTLSEDFSTMYTNLESVYQEQLEEMLALPILLKATHIKLQEDTDMRVLAEDTRDKLEREIQEIENVRIPTAPEDLVEKRLYLEAENELITSKLKVLDTNIVSAKTTLNAEIEELNVASQKVKVAIFESNKHINAFKSFSTIRMDKIIHDVHGVQELLTELQSKQCAKALTKKMASEHLKEKIKAINKTVEKSRIVTSKLLDQMNAQYCITL